MDCSNLNFKYPHATLVDGYFYMFDHVNDIFYKKANDGSTMFTYPVPAGIGSEVVAVDYDGVYFWSMHLYNNNKCIKFKKWLVKDYLCLHRDTVYVENKGSICYTADTFFLDKDRYTLTSPVARGDSVVYLSTDYIDPGTVLVFNDDFEQATVTGTVNSGIGLDFYVANDHAGNVEVSVLNDIYFFNTYDNGTKTNLYKLDFINKELSVVKDDMDHVYASCFVNMDGIKYGMFVYGSVLSFFNIYTLQVDKAMTLDNIGLDGITVFKVYDVFCNSTTVFRLQKSFNYYGVTNNYTTYNYQCSMLTSFIDSVSMSVTPSILNNDGISVADIKVIVKNQYSDPAMFAPVVVIDDNETGFITIPNGITGSDGVFSTYYKSGIDHSEVQIITKVFNS